MITPAPGAKITPFYADLANSSSSNSSRNIDGLDPALIHHGRRGEGILSLGVNLFPFISFGSGDMELCFGTTVSKSTDLMNEIDIPRAPALAYLDPPPLIDKDWEPCAWILLHFDLLRSRAPISSMV